LQVIDKQFNIPWIQIKFCEKLTPNRKSRYQALQRLAHHLKTRSENEEYQSIVRDIKENPDLISSFKRIKRPSYMNSSYAKIAISRGDMDVFLLCIDSNWVNQDMDLCAAEHGQVPFLIWLYEAGCKFTETTSRVAVKNKGYEALKYLYSVNCPFEYYDSTEDLELNQFLEQYAPKWFAKHNLYSKSKYLSS
jgi:hypothetical protein